MSPTKTNGTGHCDTLVVDDEPTEGVSGSTTEALCALAPVGLLPSSPIAVRCNAPIAPIRSSSSA